MKQEGSLAINRSRFLVLTAALSGATAVACSANYATGAPAADAVPDAASRGSSSGSSSGSGSSGSSSGSSSGGGSGVDAGADAATCGGGCGPGLCLGGQCCYPTTEGTGACVIYPECGCPSGEMCVNGTGGNQCVPDGNTPAYGQCQSPSSCQPNLACSGGLCEGMCATNADCPTGWACLMQYAGASYLGYSACSPHCNPVASFTSDATHEGCVNGVQRCDPLFNSQGQTSCDAPAGTGVQGSPCTTNADCAPNFGCVAPGGQSSRCEQFCDIGGGFPQQCSGGLACAAFTTAQYEGTQEIGVCQ